MARVAYFNYSFSTLKRIDSDDFDVHAVTREVSIKTYKRNEYKYGVSNFRNSQNAVTQ